MIPILRRTFIAAIVLLTIASAVSLIALWIQPNPQIAQLAGTVSVAPVLLSLFFGRRAHQ